VITDKVLYRSLVSLLFGWVSFFISLHPLQYIYEGQVTSIHMGLIVPLIISVAWGWRYGLVTCVFGLGTQYGWFIWYRSGWGALLGVATHTLWIVWHGWCGEHGSVFHQWKGIKHNIYLRELVIRCLLVPSYFILFPFAVSFNPAFFAPEFTSTAVPVEFIVMVVVKQAFVGVVLVLVCDALLSMQFVRHVLGLSTNSDDYDAAPVLGVSLLVGIVFGLIDTVVGHVYFTNNTSFMDSLLFHPDPYRIYTRTFLLLVCLTYGLGYAKYIKKYKISNKKLEVKNKELCQIFEVLPSPLLVVNEKKYLVYMSRRLRELFKLSESDHLMAVMHEKQCFDIMKLPICNTPECPLEHQKEVGYCSSFIQTIDGKEYHCEVCLIDSKKALDNGVMVQYNLQDNKRKI